MPPLHILCGFEKVEAKGTIWKSFKECQIMSDPERVKPTSARLLPVKAQPASVSRSWQARTVRLTAAGPSADGTEAPRNQVDILEGASTQLQRP
jgi:hypothetical protein